MTIWCGGMLLNITMAAHPIAVAVTPIMTVGPWCRRKSLAGMQPYVSLPRSQDTSYIHRTAGQLAVHTAVAAGPPWTEVAREIHDRIKSTRSSQPPPTCCAGCVMHPAQNPRT